MGRRRSYGKGLGGATKGRVVKGPKKVNVISKKTVQSKGIGTGPAPKTISKTTVKRVSPKKFKEEFGKKALKSAKKSGMVKRLTSMAGGKGKRTGGRR